MPGGTRKLSARRPDHAAAPSQDVERFIAGDEPPAAQGLPWEGCNDENVKLFNLRLPESYKKKLEFIAKQRKGAEKISAHQFCISVVLPAIDAEIERLLSQD